MKTPQQPYSSPFLVFKTSVSSQQQVDKVKYALDRMAGKGCWNFALDDDDKILSIASDNIKSELACQVMSEHGFECIELEE
jgi:hypothetical protein